MKHEMTDNTECAIKMPKHAIDEPVFVIAEIGINHNGDIGIAKQLIDGAKDAGCDAVKFQKRTIDAVYTKAVLDSPRESPFGTTQRAQKEGLEFSAAEFDEIDAYCKKVGIDWFASAWDVESQEFLRRYDLKYNKVASAMTTNLAFLEVVASEGRMTFVSTGMCTPDNVERAVEVFRRLGCPFILMHSVSTYPAAEEDLNLRCIETLRARYGCPVGYSGHEVAVSPSLMAAMLGAVAIERHITLNRAMYGSDQAASLEVDTFKRLVTMIRKIPAVLGNGEKRIMAGEEEVAKKLRYWEADATPQESVVVSLPSGRRAAG